MPTVIPVSREKIFFSFFPQLMKNAYCRGEKKIINLEIETFVLGWRKKKGSDSATKSRRQRQS